MRTGELSEHNRGRDDSEITLTQITECPSCKTTIEAVFHTGAFDEDGLTDLSDELAEKQQCTNPLCRTEWMEPYTGWSNFGEAG